MKSKLMPEHIDQFMWKERFGRTTRDNVLIIYCNTFLKNTNCNRYDDIVLDLFTCDEDELFTMLEFLDDDDDDGSSSSDEEIFDLLDNEHGQPPRNKPRIKNFMEEVVHVYNDKEFRGDFRMSRTAFNYLINLIGEDLEGNGEGRKTISAERQLCIALYYLGTPDSYRSITAKFGVGLGTAWRAVLRVVKAVCKYRNYCIRWPTSQEAIATQEYIRIQYGFPNVIGAIDGTHIPILSPKLESQSYINRKGFPSIQLQVVCNHNLEFIHCFAGMPGSVHDARVFKYSGIQRRCNANFFPGNNHLIGDSAYTLQERIMVPYKDNGHLTVEEKYFNKRLSSARMMIERAIGLLKQRIRILLHKTPLTKTMFIPYYVLCCCILHNICLKEDELQAIIEFPAIDANANSQGPTDVDKLEGSIRRERLKNVLNA